MYTLLVAMYPSKSCMGATETPPPTRTHNHYDQKIINKKWYLYDRSCMGATETPPETLTSNHYDQKIINKKWYLYDWLGEWYSFWPTLGPPSGQTGTKFASRTLPWQERTDTFEHVENGISTINRVRDKAVGPLQDHLLAKPTQNLQVEVCHDLDRAITFEHVENGNCTINRLRDIASDPLQDHLLVKPHKNLQHKLFYDLDCAITFEHIENSYSTINRVRGIAS